MGVIIIIILIIVAGLIIKHKFINWMEQGAAEALGETEAITSQINAANNGDVEAMKWLVMYYMNERNNLEDLSSKRAEDLKNCSIKWLMEAINYGDTDSMLELSRQYSRYLNTDQSGEELITNNLGFGYDPDKELALIHMAAEAGNPEGQHRLGLRTKDDRNKLYWLNKSAEQGYIEAYRSLGDFYHRDITDLNKEREDLGKAEYYYYLAMQSDDEDTRSSAAYQLGIIFGRSYCYGNVPNSYEDPERASYWFYQSSLLENEYAQKQIDKILQNSKITISENKYRQWLSDFENSHFLTDKRLIPEGTKYHFQKES